MRILRSWPNDMPEGGMSFTHVRQWEMVAIAVLTAAAGAGSAAMFRPSSTGLVKKVEEEVLPTDDDAEKARISAQRRSLDKVRRGRQSLRVDLTKNPGVASTGNSGIRIPE